MYLSGIFRCCYIARVIYTRCYARVDDFLNIRTLQARHRHYGEIHTCTKYYYVIYAVENC